MHTPGPWKIKKTEDGNIIVISVGKNGWMNLIVGEMNGILHRKDARLISAAPELLEALKAIVGRAATGDFRRIAQNGEISQAHAAIAKAEGK